MITSWDELIDTFGTRPGMWVGRPRYSLVCSFVAGFGAAQDDTVLSGFEQWLGEQPQNQAIHNFGWPALLLHEAFPSRTKVIKPPWQDEPAAADPDWPLPPPTPVGEEELIYPAEDAVAIHHLFARLREYLLDRSTTP